MQSRFPVDPLPQPKPVIRAGKPPENLPRTEPTPIPQPKPKTYIPVRNDCAWFAVSENGQQWKLAQGRFLDKDALCVLKVGNGTEHAAIGKVIDMFTDRKVCEFVVLSKTSITLEHVPEGKYSLIYVLGDEIVKGTNRFWEPLEYTRIEAPFEFKTRQLIQEVEYSVLSITLHGVRGGKAKAEAIEGKEFGKY